MSNEWKKLLRAYDDLRISGDDVEVKFKDGRRHVVTFSEGDETIELSAIVTRSRASAAQANDALSLWRRHRALSLVTFRQDRHGRLIGESWLPKVDASGDELRLHLWTLAAECDRLEHTLTGRDVE